MADEIIFCSVWPDYKGVVLLISINNVFAIFFFEMNSTLKDDRTEDTIGVHKFLKCLKTGMQNEL